MIPRNNLGFFLLGIGKILVIKNNIKSVNIGIVNQQLTVNSQHHSNATAFDIISCRLTATSKVNANLHTLQFANQFDNGQFIGHDKLLRHLNFM